MIRSKLFKMQIVLGLAWWSNVANAFLLPSAVSNSTMDAAEAAADATAEAAGIAATEAIEGADANEGWEALTESELVEFNDNWQEVAVSSDQSYWYLKGKDWSSTSTVSKPIWVKTDHSKDKTVDYRLAMRLVQFDCDMRKVKYLSATAYGANGSVKFSDDTSYRPWTYVVPESVTDELINAVCKS